MHAVAFCFRWVTNYLRLKITVCEVVGAHVMSRQQRLRLEVDNASLFENESYIEFQIHPYHKPNSPYFCIPAIPNPKSFICAPKRFI